MRFISISAAVLIGSAVSAAGAQQLTTSAGTKPGSQTSAINTAAKASGGSGQVFVTTGGGPTCATAVPISGAGVFAGDTTGATLDGPTAICSGPNDHDVWYDWTALATGATTMTTCPTSGGGMGTAAFDTVLVVRDTAACLGAGIACNDDQPGCSLIFRSTLSFPATSGSVYKIQLLGYATGDEGTYALEVTTPPPVVAPPNDLCASAIPIVGTGTTPGTNVGADFDGPAGSAGCAGSGPVADVWYDWTATATGPHQVTTCVGFGGSSTFDSILHAYNGPGCAPVGSLAACDDDGAGGPCPGFQSDMLVNATSGNVYKIRVMGWSSGEEGTFDLTINPPPPPTPLDSCQAPGIYAGGVVPWSNVGMTTDGGVESCGNPQQDIWYVWNATCTGEARLSLCPGGLTPDTVVAVYNGNTCPTAGTAIGCDDDFCSAPAFGSSSAAFCATLGQDYMLRIGGFGGVTGSGLFEVTPCTVIPEGTCLVYDDGVTETSVGFGVAGPDIMWMHTHGVAGQSTVVKSISTAWGTPLFGGTSGPPDFSPARVGIWQDVDQDGIPGNNPNDTVKLDEIVVAVAGSNTDVKQNVPLTTPLLITGTYFIGASTDLATFPAPLDGSSGQCPGSRAWIVASTSGPLDYDDLENEELPPADVNGFSFGPGYWLLEAECKDLEIEEICGVVSDSTLECPCNPPGSTSLSGHGCPHSGSNGGNEGLNGARLLGSGVSLIGAGDTVSVTAFNVRQGNGAISLFLQGDNDPSIPFNDGLICSSNNVLKLWSWKDPVGPAGSGGGITTQTGPGASTIPPTTSISQRSSDLGSPILNGQTRVYTMVFRDPAPGQGCPGLSTVNTTNGLRVLWSQL